MLASVAISPALGLSSFRRTDSSATLFALPVETPSKSRIFFEKNQYSIHQVGLCHFFCHVSSRPFMAWLKPILTNLHAPANDSATTTLNRNHYMSICQELLSKAQHDWSTYKEMEFELTFLAGLKMVADPEMNSLGDDLACFELDLEIMASHTLIPSHSFKEDIGLMEMIMLSCSDIHTRLQQQMIRLQSQLDLVKPTSLPQNTQTLQTLIPYTYFHDMIERVWFSLFFPLKSNHNELVPTVFRAIIGVALCLGPSTLFDVSF